MKFLAAVVALLIAAIAIAAGYGAHELNHPYKGFSEPVFIDFAHGTSTRQMASTLAQRGVIENPWVFLAARTLRRGVPLQAGEYRFEKPSSPLDIFGRIARGDIFYEELLVPEGFNMFEIADAVGKLGMLSPRALTGAAERSYADSRSRPFRAFTRRLSFSE